MDHQDLLFKTENGVFSYRVAGVIIHDGKVLLQHEIQDPGYVYPGGHVLFGELSEDALIREIKEEIGTEIRVVRLLWIGENFFPWGKQECHQVCLYYLVALSAEPPIPLEGCFRAQDELDGKTIDLEFCWIPHSDLAIMEVYPSNTKEKLMNLSDQIERFTYVEKGQP